MKTIKEMVSNGKKVHFKFYRSEELWYETECGFEFPVHISECGDTPYPNEEKAMLFMRFIRKHHAFIEQSMKEQAAA